MHVHVLQHVAFEGLGNIEAALLNRGVRITYTRFFEHSDLPAVDDIDVVIALGGPMSANDDDQFPWLWTELRFIAEAVMNNKAVLGICLGAQLIARALGAKVYPGTEKEIGWFPVFAEPMVAKTFVFPKCTDVFHWHSETFNLPLGAVRLARSTVCHNQAFQLGTKVIGLQFHLEITPADVDRIISNCAGDLRFQQRYIQTEPELRAIPQGNYEAINQLMIKVLDYLSPPGPSLRPNGC